MNPNLIYKYRHSSSGLILGQHDKDVPKLIWWYEQAKIDKNTKQVNERTSTARYQNIL